MTSDYKDDPGEKSVKANRPSPRNVPAAASRGQAVRGIDEIDAVLFDTEAEAPKRVDIESIDVDEILDTQLLWIDIDDVGAFDDVHRALRLPRSILDAVRAPEERPGIVDAGDCFWLRACAAEDEDGADHVRFETIDVAAGRNFVVTIRGGSGKWPKSPSDPSSLRQDLGPLSAASLVAAHLHALLAAYFEAVSRIEIAVERIDQEILDPGHTRCMDELRSLLRATSQLRRALASHRALFTTLGRPDFRHSDIGEARGHFAALDAKYERAMDVVESSRDMVIDCFELFSSRTALSTNRSMRALTFLTVLIGMLAVGAGVLGMNFKVRFFDSEAGFWITLGSMLLAGLAAVLFARHRHWM